MPKKVIKLTLFNKSQFLRTKKTDQKPQGKIRIIPQLKK